MKSNKNDNKSTIKNQFEVQIKDAKSGWQVTKISKQNDNDKSKK
jgi:hypothetical protein